MQENMKPKLLIAPCDYKAAKYAVEHWHYSKCMPAGKTVKLGVWENDIFIGVIIFSRGAAPKLGKPYNLKQNELCELTRVALSKHLSPVSKIVSIAIKVFKTMNKGIRLIVSFADPLQKHYGGIYQAMNWLYAGETEQYREIVVNGQGIHRRSAGSKFPSYSISYLKENVDTNAHYTYEKGKYRYLYPLDSAMREQIKPLAKPYPKKQE